MVVGQAGHPLLPTKQGLLNPFQLHTGYETSWLPAYPERREGAFGQRRPTGNEVVEALKAGSGDDPSGAL
jgi:hypothetical protein